MNKRKLVNLGFAPVIVVIVLAVLAIGGGAYYLQNKKSNQPVGCTMEALICPDGVTSIGRTGPNCEFEKCPEVKEETLNGTEKQIGYIKKIYEKDGKRYLEIDYVQWLEGDAAQQAALADKQCEQLDYCTPNGFYIRNQNTQLRTFEISGNAQVFRSSAFDYSDTGIKPISYEELKSLITSSDIYTKIIPFNIETANGVVLKITEQYIP